LHPYRWLRNDRFGNGIKFTNERRKWLDTTFYVGDGFGSRLWGRSFLSGRKVGGSGSGQISLSCDVEGRRLNKEGGGIYSSI